VKAHVSSCRTSTCLFLPELRDNPGLPMERQNQSRQHFYLYNQQCVCCDVLSLCLQPCHVPAGGPAAAVPVLAPQQTPLLVYAAPWRLIAEACIYLRQPLLLWLYWGLGCTGAAPSCCCSSDVD
jgi:hypothetical protein